MCDDLNTILKAQTIKVKTPAWAVTMMEAAVASMKKTNERLAKHIEESDTRWSNVDARIQGLEDKIARLTTVIEGKLEDATKYRLVVEVFKALFGDTKKSIRTLLYIGIIFGLVNFKDVLEIIKALII